ncbi:MAG: hypothetical protein J6U40_03990 [Kiritimatiellae bacterium]|nr:hypothetical protein [Kiritimatiellia bacterium]
MGGVAWQEASRGHVERGVFDGLKSLYAAMAYDSTETSVHENAYGRCLSFLHASQGSDFAMENVPMIAKCKAIAARRKVISLVRKMCQYD